MRTRKRMSPYDIEGIKPDWYWCARHEDVARVAAEQRRRDRIVVNVAGGITAVMLIATVVLQIAGYGPR